MMTIETAAPAPAPAKISVLEQKTHDKRIRAVEAAQKVLGKEAVEGTDFELRRLETTKRWYWAPLKVDQPKAGDIVSLIDTPQSRGKVLVAGPSVCEVKWENGKVDNELNSYLRVSPPVKPELEEGIPEFLKVKNRKPLTPEQQKKLEERQKTIGEIAEQKRDTRLPRNIEPAGLEILKQQEEPLKKERAPKSASPTGEVKTKSVKVPREGSRKHTVFTTYKAEGEAAATKKAVALGLAEGTAKSWLGKWKRAAL